MAEQQHLQRDHLFISYASEDAALADWLARKLAAKGYLVWLDRLKLLGGEPWPDDIDAAIKLRTFRVIHLLSHHSLDKPNPKKERQLALTLSKERSEPDFLIPLNIDGIKPGQLPWQVTDINFIPFSKWSSGLSQLIEKLESIQTPQFPVEGGRGLAIQSFHQESAISEKPEYLESNCWVIDNVPSSILCFKGSRALFGGEKAQLHESWPYFAIGKQSDTFFSFTNPPAVYFEGFSIEKLTEIKWAVTSEVSGFKTRDILKYLLEQYLAYRAIQSGMKWFRNELYFPKNAVARNKIWYTRSNGRRASILVTSIRKLRNERYVYYLACWLRARDDVWPKWVVQARPSLVFSDMQDNMLETTKNNTLRKNITKSWHNRQWYSRTLAIFNHIAAGASEISISNDVGSPIVYRRGEVAGEVPTSIDELFLKSRGIVLEDGSVVPRE